jgi:glutamyl/glutaminyl-tRNA synthetase
LKRLSQSEQEEGIETFLSPKITESEGYDIVRLRRVTPLIIERISVFSDVKILSDEGELDYYFIRPTYKPESLLWKNEGTLNDVCSHLKHLSTILNALSEKEFTQQDIKSAVWGYAEEKGRGTVLWPMRYALSGRDKSPDPFALASVLEKNETSARLEYAIKLTQ